MWLPLCAGVGSPVLVSVMNLHCPSPDQVSKDLSKPALESRPAAVGRESEDRARQLEQRVEDSSGLDSESMGNSSGVLTQSAEPLPVP